VPPRKSKQKNSVRKKSERHSRPKQVSLKSARRQSSPKKEPARPPVGKLFEDLVAVQARLRAPGGCPWDREQTHATLKTYLIEEAYEVLDALESGNSAHLSEELGDLLLQILFHSDLALEAGTFNLSDVIQGIRDKMIRRHPHVFGDVKAKTSAEVLKNWAQLKAQEKLVVSGSSPVGKSLVVSALDGVSRNLPASLEAYQLTRKAAQVGFDWDKVEGIFEKMREEIGELRAALEVRDHRGAEEEIGDVLFVAVNLARFLGFDPEVALKCTNLKFKSRFQLMEEEATRSGQRLSQLSEGELEVLWKAAKARSRGSLEIQKSSTKDLITRSRSQS
jgi:tetrapyrrole methylase family protein / MazG family protein